LASKKGSYTQKIFGSGGLNKMNSNDSIVAETDKRRGGGRGIKGGNKKKGWGKDRTSIMLNLNHKETSGDLLTVGPKKSKGKEKNSAEKRGGKQTMPSRGSHPLFSYGSEVKSPGMPTEEIRRWETTKGGSHEVWRKRKRKDLFLRHA